MRSFVKSALIVCATIGFGTAVLAADPPAEKKPEAQIPFVNFGGIDNWQADGEQGVYIQGRGRKDWYYAKLFAPCIDLPWVQRIGFKAEPTGTLDKFGSIIVKGRECHIASLTKSDGPPKKAKKDKAEAKDDAKKAD